MKNKMIRNIVWLWLVLLTNTMSGFAQNIVYHDASLFPVIGKISADTETRYERLPVSLRDRTRLPVWYLGQHTAGLAVRFTTNSTMVAVRWTLRLGSSMNHMAPTGVNGMDLYCLESQGWRYVGTARPAPNSEKVLKNATIVKNMKAKNREFMLFLPLYDGVTALEIGVDTLARIAPPVSAFPDQRKPIVAYGTSILQGGCASRPGMAVTNILTRRLNRQVINLGFSGQGQLDYEIAELMADCDASLYILDFMPNVSVPQINDKVEKFFRIIRRERPNVPVLFVENPIYPTSHYDTKEAQEIKAKNDALRRVFSRLGAKGEKNIALLYSGPLIGDDCEATVDGVHFTDLGFSRYADYLYPRIKELWEDVKR